MKSKVRGKISVILDDSPTVDARARLEHEHGQAGIEGLFRDQTTDDAGPHDNDIRSVITCHAYSFLFAPRRRIQNSGMLSNGGASAVQAFGPEIA